MCLEVGCARKVKTRGRCAKCHKAALAEGRIPRAQVKNEGEVCRHEECNLPAKFRRLCSTHFARWKRGGETEDALYFRKDGTRYDEFKRDRPCAVSDCPEPYYALDWCRLHYDQARRGEDPYLLSTRKSCEVPHCLELIGRRATLCRDHQRQVWLYSWDRDAYVEANQPENYKCQNPACDKAENLHLDHDHSCCGPNKFKTRVSCGECVRGWLCPGCNLALGHARENANILAGLVDYLENAKAPGTSN